VKFIHSDMAELTFFVRMDNGERLEWLRAKNQGGNQSVYGGSGLKSYCHTTLTVTVDLTDSDGGCVRLYVGGELIAEEMLAETDMKSVSSLYLGSNARYAKWGGELHGVRVYTRALTAEEVRANAEADRLTYRLEDVENSTVPETDTLDEDILTDTEAGGSDSEGADTAEAGAETDGSTTETKAEEGKNPSCGAVMAIGPVGAVLMACALMLKKKKVGSV
jgi:hypothetical protein